MPKEYTLPESLFASRVRSAITSFTVTTDEATGARIGTAQLDCGHSVQTVNTRQPPEGARLLCRVCSGFTKTDYITKVQTQ